MPFEIDGLESGDLTEGHRFMGAGVPFRARDFDDYREALAGHFVVLDATSASAASSRAPAPLCAARGLELVEDEGLLDEVAGLAEWPVPILGDMDPAFLDLPPEVIRTSMRTHQKYFAVRDPATGAPGPALRRRRQYRGHRRRRADRRRQRPGAVGAAERRPLLLGRGPQGRRWRAGWKS